MTLEVYGPTGGNEYVWGSIGWYAGTKLGAIVAGSVRSGILTSMVQPVPSVCTMVQCLRLMCAAAAGAIATDAGPVTRPRFVVVHPYPRVRGHR